MHVARCVFLWLPLAGGCSLPPTARVDLPHLEDVSELAQIAPGWDAELIAEVDQSYAGWTVEIGDSDGDGQPEILTGSAPDSRVYRFRKRQGVWQSHIVLEHEAGADPGIVLGVRVVDLDGDGEPEIVAGTGEEDSSVARLGLFRSSGRHLTLKRTMEDSDNASSYTHGLATADLDGDGIQEIISSYCGNGEVIRYDVTPGTMELSGRKVLQLSGSGEGAIITDLDGDGRPELILSNGYRDNAARVQIHDLDPVTGDPSPQPRLVIDGYDGHGAFYASIAVGDLDGDGRPELIVGWKGKQDVNRATLLAYHVSGASAEVAYLLADEDPSFDLGYFEKMIAVADVDGDGRNEMIVSTRGDGLSEGIASDHLGYVYLFRISPDGEVQRERLVDFNAEFAESSWLAVGDADGDGKPEIVLATGKGDRTQPGRSWVLALHKSP
jgi:hypothetical protein